MGLDYQLLLLLQRVFNQNTQILTALGVQSKELQTMAVDITALQTAVANETTVDASVETLLTNLAAQIATLSAASTDPATQTALNGLVTTMQTNATTLAAAVTANTPAAPATPAA